MPLPDEKEPDFDPWKYAAENSPRWLDEDIDTVWPSIAPALFPITQVRESTPVVGPAAKYVSDMGKGAAKAAVHQFNPFEAIPGSGNAIVDPWGAVKAAAGQAYNIVRPDATAEERGAGLFNTAMVAKGGLEAYHGLFPPAPEFHPTPLESSEPESPWSPLMSGSDELGAGESAWTDDTDLSAGTADEQGRGGAEAKALRRAAARIQEALRPVASRSLPPGELVDRLTDEIGRTLDAHQQNYPDYKSFNTEDVPEGNGLLRAYVKWRYGRDLTDAEVDLYHYLSSMGSPRANPLVDSSRGMLLFDRYLRTGQVSPYAGDANLWTSTLNGTRRNLGVTRVQDGVVQPGKLTKAYAADSVIRLNRLLQDKFDGDLGATMDWLKTEHPNSEIQALTGRPVFKNEYTTGTSSKGVFGIANVKTGSYWLNRVGDLTPVVKDAWIARMCARLLGEPLTDRDGAVITEPWSAGKPDGLKLRQILDTAVSLAGDMRGLSPAEVQERLWDAEQRLYNSYGAPGRPTYVSDGVRLGIDKLNAGKSLEPYEPGRIATPAEARNAQIWKILSSLRRSLYAGESIPTGGDPGIYEPSSRVGGYTRDEGLSSSALLRVRGLDRDVGDAGVPLGDSFKPGTDFSQAINSLGGVPRHFYEVSDSHLFHALVKRAHDQNPLVRHVGNFSPEDYEGMHLYVTRDGETGFALSGDEIVSPFTSGRRAMAAHSLLQLATDLGGRRVRVLDTFSPRTFSQMGFKAAARVPFDQLLLPEDHEPAISREFNGGQPDIVYMVWDPANAAEYIPGAGELVANDDLAVVAQKTRVAKIRQAYNGRMPRLRY